MVTTDEVLAVVARSPQNWGSRRHQWLVDELSALGADTADLARAALAGLDDEDRNVRVRAVWALSVVTHPLATAGVVRALHDPVRRVREVALKAVQPNHVGSPDVVAAVRAIVDDEQETGRLRRNAFFVLSSSGVRNELPDVAEETLRSFMASEQFRAPVLLRLCTTTNHSPASRAILQEFVRSGSKEEAVMATRALCGHRLMRADALLPPDLRRRVREQYDPAPDVYYGVPLYWIPADEAAALAEEAGIGHLP